MKKLILSLSILSICFAGYSQANGSFYTLKLGKNTCLFKYREERNSTYADTDSAHSTTIVTQINPVTLAEKTKWVKDTLVLKKSLTLQDTSTKTIHTRVAIAIDTVTSIDPVSMREDVKVVKQNDASYHVETTMSYSDFLILLKSKFELRNPQRNFRVYSFTIYYETADKNGRINVQYPQSYEGVISTLNCLTKGGFILLQLDAADHDEVPIDAQRSYLALIHIKN